MHGTNVERITKSWSPNEFVAHKLENLMSIMMMIWRMMKMMLRHQWQQLSFCIQLIFHTNIFHVCCVHGCVVILHYHCKHHIRIQEPAYQSATNGATKILDEIKKGDRGEAFFFVIFGCVFDMRRRVMFTFWYVIVQSNNFESWLYFNSNMLRLSSNRCVCVSVPSLFVIQHVWHHRHEWFFRLPNSDAWALQ